MDLPYMPGASNKSPLTGYNHNLKYKGRVYHVQTEDSGLQSPHVFTHLFFDGTILATNKTDYDHVLESDDWTDKVRLIMQNSHKEMMKKLLRGAFNEKITQFLGSLEIPEAAVVESEKPAPPTVSAPKKQEKKRPAVVISSPVVVVSGRQSSTRGRRETKSFAGEYSSRGIRENVAHQKEDKTPDTSSDSIFGNINTVDEKSLDEVILAYLAEDLPDE